MRQFGYPPYQQPVGQPNFYNQQTQQPFHSSQYQQYYPNLYEQAQSPFEQFAKPKQPQDWYANLEQQSQGSNQQAQQQNATMSQFQNQSGQMNLDKVLTTVSQIANTYHQVSPIIKQFGDFMKTFR